MTGALLPVDPASAMAAELLGFEAERQRALVEPDLVSLERLLAPDLIHVHSSGLVHDKPAFIAHVARMGGFVSIERGALDVRSGHGVALITGPTVNTVRRIESGELARLEGFGTVLARHTADGWQVVLSQITITKHG